MRGRCIIYPLISFLSVLLFSQAYGRDSYEDYIDRKNKTDYYEYNEIKSDRVLSDIKPDERDVLLDELRGVVREELNGNPDSEKKAVKKNNKNSRFAEDVRSIVKEEIDEAIRIKQGRYPAGRIFETGVLFSYKAKGAGSDDNDDNILKVFPQVSFFIDKNVALALKGGVDFNLTDKTRAYSVCAGTQFVYGITKTDDVCLYADIMAGISRNSEISNDTGFRYSNGFGLKFVTVVGVSFNAGVQLVFDNLDDSVTGFQKSVEPVIGITAWF